jgi:hypothetical protein
VSSRDSSLFYDAFDRAYRLLFKNLSQKKTSKRRPSARAMSLEVPPFSGPHPTICVLENRTLKLHSYSQLAQKDKRQAHALAKTLRDSLGGFVELIPPLPPAVSLEAIIFWTLMVQCSILSYAGLQMTPQSFGAPEGFDGAEKNWMR